MSGHSKWAGIKHKKAAVDAKRGKIFTKLIKEITVAARIGGGDPEGNSRLRGAIQSARAANMPADNIQRAIKKGTGELPGVVYEEIIYEGYAPGGVAVLVESMTDNKNRLVAELRHMFSKSGGSLGEAGCVSWMFEKKGMILVDGSAISEDELISIALDAGAEDVRPEGDGFEVITGLAEFESVKRAIVQKGITPSVAELSMIPQSTIRVEGKQAHQVLKLMEILEDHDDIQHVYANFDIPDEILAEVGS